MSDEMKEFVKQARLEEQVRRDFYTTALRIAIGKTEDIRQPLCMHAAIVAREMAQRGVTICRVCNTPLGDGKARVNDHLVLRHPECVQPICWDCSKNRPDEFHKAYKRGVESLKEMGI